MNWLTKNWRTTLIGVSYIGCNVSAIFVPFMAEICPWIDKVLITGGFLASADSATLTKLNTSALDMARTMKGRSVAGALFALLLLTGYEAHAQTVTVDLNRAVLAWDWTKGIAPSPTTGDVERFDVKCGRQAGVYSSVTPLTDPLARSVRISQIVNGTGQWFCVVASVNRYGSAGNSNEISFDAGAVPATPANVRVQAQ